MVVLTHGTNVFTSDERFSVRINLEFSLKYYSYSHFFCEFQSAEENGIWSLVIKKVGHSDAGFYECQTNNEVKRSVTVKLEIKGTRLSSAKRGYFCDQSRELNV